MSERAMFANLYFPVGNTGAQEGLTFSIEIEFFRSLGEGGLGSPKILYAEFLRMLFFAPEQGCYMLSAGRRSIARVRRKQSRSTTANTRGNKQLDSSACNIHRTSDQPVCSSALASVTYRSRLQAFSKQIGIVEH